MRYVVTIGQTSFFQKEGHIELEELFNQAEVQELYQLLEKAQSKTPSSEGYELERTDQALHYAMHFQRLAHIAAPLFKQKRLRIGFTKYPPHYNLTGTILEISSLTDVHGGVLINLGATPPPDKTYLPRAPGNGTFISPEISIDFTSLNAPYLLVVFAGANARYILQETDPHTHRFKKFGYAFGDRITVETHPIITKNFLH